ncbi:MAG TPA: hypothetical protein VMW72_06765 [Sedimentisphaerales bacterium]|nr:hypothetical protein [Sedimentisphaerales bacterium]
MKQEINLKEIEQKAYRDSNQDGLMEIMIGILLTGLGATFGSGLYVFAILLPIFLFPYFMGAVRKRYTYPRIGYAKLPTDGPKKTAKGMFGYTAVVLALMVICFLLLGKVKDAAAYKKWSPALMGVLLVGGFLYAHGKSGSVRYIVFSLLSVGFGLLFSIMSFESYNGLIINFFVMGGIFIVTGFTLFIFFLHKNPKLAE